MYSLSKNVKRTLYSLLIPIVISGCGQVGKKIEHHLLFCSQTGNSTYVPYVHGYEIDTKVSLISNKAMTGKSAIDYDLLEEQYKGLPKHILQMIDINSDYKISKCESFKF